MRVVTGSLRGRRIELPKNSPARPTSGRVREAVFSTLSGLIEWDGAAVLDLYAGSGLLGIEAISRGAARATFVERDAAVAKLLKSNLERLGVTSSGEVIVSDVLKQLSAWKKGSPGSHRSTPGGFRVVFADPPYDVHSMGSIIGLLAEAGVVGAGSILVFERAAERGQSAREGTVEGAPSLTAESGERAPLLAQHLFTRRYSGTEIVYYRFETRG